MTEKEIHELLLSRYKSALKKFRTTQRISPCTRDFMHGRLSEIRELILAIIPDGRSEMEAIENDM